VNYWKASDSKVATTGGWVVWEFEYRRAWPLGPLCGTLRNVAKPELVIDSNPEDNFLRARCSGCPEVRFNVVGNTLADKTHLRQMFDIHFRQAHMRVEAIGANDSAR